VIRKPKVVMAEVGNIRAASLMETFIIGTSLMTNIVFKVDPSDSLILDGGNDLF
jgi:hypothetical protein